MEKLILKVGGRGDRASAIYKFVHQDMHPNGISIGRAYSNDVIIDDAFVSATQFVLSANDQGTLLEVVDAINPVFINRRLIKSSTVYVNPGATISVGRTHIEVLTSHSEVAPTRQQFVSAWSRAGKISPVIAFMALIIYALLESFAVFFQTSTDLEWRDPAYLTLFSAAMLFVWAGVWALAGRLLKHQSLFSVQLFLTSVVSGAFIFISPIAEYIDFNANDSLPGEIASYGIAFLFFAVLLKVNLTVATNLQHSSRAAILSSLFLFGIGFAVVRYYQGEFSQEQSYPMTIKPPFAMVRTPLSIEDYFSEVATIEHQELQ